MPLQLFIPCFIDQSAPYLARTLTTLLDTLHVQWQYPAQQTCCGQFAYNTGDFTSARRLMRHFMTVFAGDDPILCPGASCLLTVRHHYPNLVDSPADATRLRRLQPRLFELGQWLAAFPASWSLPQPRTLVFHQSCSARQLGLTLTVRQLLARVGQLTLLDPPAHHACCGFGGLFSLTQAPLADAIGLAYLQAIQAMGASGLVSTDASCLMHLNRLIQLHHLPLHTLHLVELLAVAAPGPGASTSTPPL